MLKRIKPPCLLGPTSSPRSMIRLSSRIGKRYLEVFHVKSGGCAHARKHRYGRFEVFRYLKTRHGGGDNVWIVKFERVVQRVLLTSRRD